MGTITPLATATAAIPSSDDKLEALSIIDDITGLVHGKGGPEKARLAIDLVKNGAGDLAEILALVPGGQLAAAIAGTVAAGAAALEGAVAST
jgi:hypothetical protein